MTIREVTETASTQDDLLRLVSADGAPWPHLSGLRADRQIAGRGRTGRRWDTHGVRALTVSYVLRPAAELGEWGTIALRAGAAVVNALAGKGISTALKWPNDIVINSPDDVEGWHGIAKVAGVLGSVTTDSEGERVCVVGIGLNLEGAPQLAGAGSLETTLEAHELAIAIRDQLGTNVPQKAPTFPELGTAIAPYCHTLGKNVVVTLPQGVEREEIRGTASRIDPDGALVVATSTGEHRILNGDIAQTRLQAPIG